MKYKKILFSALAVALLLLHQFWPAVTMDWISIAIILIAVFPWVAPWLATFVKSLSFGDVKIDFAAVKGSIDESDLDQAIGDTAQRPADALDEDQEIEERLPGTEDPGLTLISFRLEIERTLARIAQEHGVKYKSSSLSSLVTALSDGGFIGPWESDIRRFIELGNKAAHGVTVTEDAAEWVREKGPALLSLVEQNATMSRI